MKKLFPLLLLLSLCLIVPAYAAEDDFVIENGVLVKYIGNGGDVIIPDNVVVIGDAVFWEETAITSVTIPSSVRIIESDAFIYCSGLTRVVISEGVKRIGAGAFEDCTNLTDVTIPKSVQEIGGCAFVGTPWGERMGDFFVVNDTLFEYWGWGNDGVITVPENVMTIGKNAFYNDNVGIILPEGVRRICDKAFQGSTSLIFVVIPGSVTEIGEDVFCADINDIERDRIEGMTIYGKAGSYAETYAKENGIPFVAGEPELSRLFSDVNPSDYFSEPVVWALEKGITLGTSKTEFSPANRCTKGEILTFLWRAYGKPSNPWEGQVSPFEDIDSGYYYPAALWCLEQGMITGTRFNSDTPCTRAMTVQYLWQAAGSPEPETPASFTDIPAGSAYSKAVSWAVEQGITQGTSADTFSPEATCTRGQIVTFLYRALAE